LRKERTGCNGVWEPGAVVRRGQSVTVFLGTGCWREERTECDDFWEQGLGERRGENMTVVGNRALERGESRLRRCLGTGCWREEITVCYGVW